MTILVTGGAGFVGSYLALLYKEKYSDHRIIALDNLKRRGSELNINRLKEKGIEFFHGDIRNKEDIEAIGEFNLLLECSAEPSVLAGYNSSPEYLINTNLVGTINCLEAARKYSSTIIFLSTSRVYPIKTISQLDLDETESRFEISDKNNIQGVSAKGFSEELSLEGARSLYGSTKLCSELIIQEYIDMYGIKGIINRCGVLTGPWQMGKVDQGIVVLWVARHFWKKPLSYIGYGGKGKQVRDILHVKDLFDLIDIQLQKIDELNGRIYNVGGGREVSISLKELTALCKNASGNQIQIDKITENRTADIPIYLTDNSKVTSDTNWKPKIQPEDIIKEIYQWIDSNKKELESILK